MTSSQGAVKNECVKIIDISNWFILMKASMPETSMGLTYSIKYELDKLALRLLAHKSSWSKTFFSSTGYQVRAGELLCVLYEGIIQTNSTTQILSSQGKHHTTQIHLAINTAAGWGHFHFWSLPLLTLRYTAVCGDRMLLILKHTDDGYSLTCYLSLLLYSIFSSIHLYDCLFREFIFKTLYLLIFHIIIIYWKL